VADKRRFKTGTVPTGDVNRIASADATGTAFPSSVRDVTAHETVLKSGDWNSKIGGQVLVGPLKGAPIYTLTLEERATCPRSCTHWRTCYGNSMNRAWRWRHGRNLNLKLAVEVTELMAVHERILIRLHVLGDFPDMENLKVWAILLDRFPGLHIFGFTAHRPGTGLGDGIARLRGVYPDRFAIRHSGMTGQWSSFTVDFPTEKDRLGDAAVCPEQKDAMKGYPKKMHCGACGLCWAGSTPIVFVEH
jgi:hypothetical protein